MKFEEIAITLIDGILGFLGAVIDLTCDAIDWIQDYNIRRNL